VATFAQWWLESRALIAPMMAGTGPIAGGLILVITGIYQWLPAKQAWSFSAMAAYPAESFEGMVH